MWKYFNNFMNTFEINAESAAARTDTVAALPFFTTAEIGSLKKVPGLPDSLWLGGLLDSNF